MLGETETSKCVPKKLGKFRITRHAQGRPARARDVPPEGQAAPPTSAGSSTPAAPAPSARRGSGSPGTAATTSIYLWAQQRWGEHLWGRHTIEAKFTVKDSCGKARAVRVSKLYFNHDPLPNDPIFAH